jgi:hypothetical protein
VVDKCNGVFWGDNYLRYGRFGGCISVRDWWRQNRPIFIPYRLSWASEETWIHLLVLLNIWLCTLERRTRRASNRSSPKDCFFLTPEDVTNWTSIPTDCRIQGCMTVFWDVASCSVVETYRRYRGTYCLHHQGDRRSTRRNIEENSHLYNRRRENLKSHKPVYVQTSQQMQRFTWTMEWVGCFI